MGWLKICLVISAFVFCVTAERSSPGPLTSHQHLCSPGEILEEIENGNRFYYVTENCMRKLKHITDDFKNVTGSGCGQNNGRCSQRNGGNQRNNTEYQPSNDGYQPSNDGYQPSNNGYQPSNDGYQPSNTGYQGNGGNQGSRTEDKPQPKGKKRFELQSTEMDFYQAQRNCKASGKSLAKISNKEEQDALEELIIDEGTWTTPFWIGGHYVKNVLTWIDTNRNIMYGKWAQGSPKRTRQAQGCVLVNDKDNGYRWTIAECTRFASYVCEYFEQEWTGE